MKISKATKALLGACIVSNVVWMGVFAWERHAWDVQFRESVKQAAELGFSLGHQSSLDGEWSADEVSATRLKVVASHPDGDVWSLPTYRGYNLKILNETRGDLADALVGKWSNAGGTSGNQDGGNEY